MIMKHFATISLILGLLPAAAAAQTTPPQEGEVPQWKDLFNGKDLTGWVNINTAEDTWKVRDGMLIDSGRPTGVMCSERQYQNYLLHIEWMHMEAGGNSGVFVWSNARPDPRDSLPNGVEVQMLELAWPEMHKKDGVTPPVAYVHGEVWGSAACTRRPTIRAASAACRSRIGPRAKASGTSTTSSRSTARSSSPSTESSSTG